MKIKNIYEPFNSLLLLIGTYGMATVLRDLSASARYILENAKHCEGKDPDRYKAHYERLAVNLAKLSERMNRFMRDEEIPTDKQDLN